MLIAIALSITIALLRGGSVSHLGQVRFRFPYLILVGIGLQVGIFSPWWPSFLAGLPTDLLYVDSLAFLVVAVVANIRLPGLKLLGLGLASNLLVIAANGGAMPISLEALRMAGAVRTLQAFQGQGRVRHLTAMTLHSPLWPLGDIFFVPDSPLPVPSVFSIGDVLIAAGAFWFVQETMVIPRRKAQLVGGPPNTRIELDRGEAPPENEPAPVEVDSLAGERPSWALSARRKLKLLNRKRASRD